jgi:hypothetical protein
MTSPSNAARGTRAEKLLVAYAHSVNRADELYGCCAPGDLEKLSVQFLTIGGVTPLRHAQFGRTPPSRLHDNLHVVAQGDQEPHQPLYRIATELASQHGGDLRLIDPHEFSRGRLRQPPSPDGSVNLNNQSGLDQMFAGLSQAEVRENIPRTRFLFKSLSFRHSSPRPFTLEGKRKTA